MPKSNTLNVLRRVILNPKQFAHEWKLAQEDLLNTKLELARSQKQQSLTDACFAEPDRRRANLEAVTDGHLDAVTTSQATGWAVSPEGDPPMLALSIAGNKIMEFRPSLPRSDLDGRSAASTLGFAIPLNVDPNAEVAVTSLGGRHLKGSPKRPLLNIEEMRKHFISLGWDESPVSKHVFDFTMVAAQTAKGGAILDAGAGYQACRPFFGDSIYIAQEHPQSGAEAKLISEFDILCDVKVIPLVDNCVRVVFSNVSLEHMRYPEPFFAEAYRVLEPGGKLFVQVPFIYREHEQPHDYQRPTSFGLKRWFDDAGFASCEIKPSSSSIYTVTWAGRLAIDEGRAAGKIDRLTASVAKEFFAYLKRRYDHGPFEGVQFPIGWTAIGVKRGEARTDRLAMTAKDFLEKHRDERAYFENGSLRLRS
jgi:SAM-dependent methyltransferase